jgi:hypothetical protein
VSNISTWKCSPSLGYFCWEAHSFRKITPRPSKGAGRTHWADEKLIVLQLIKELTPPPSLFHLIWRFVIMLAKGEPNSRTTPRSSALLEKLVVSSCSVNSSPFMQSEN